MSDQQKKECSTCKILKHTGAYRNDKRNRTGLASQCRKCSTEAVRAHRARKRIK